MKNIAEQFVDWFNSLSMMERLHATYLPEYFIISGWLNSEGRK